MLARVLKIIGILLGVALALVAGVFGLVILAAIFVLVGVFALFGKAKFRVDVNRGPGKRPAPPPARHGGGDVIDIEATRVEKQPELK